MTEDEYVQAYAEVCNLIERNYQEISDDDSFMHTSSAARATALKIFEALSIQPPEGA